jgi:hypothetical protein
MNVFTGARRHAKKFNVPHGGQDEPDDDNTSGEFWASEKLADGEEVYDAGKRQGGHEVRSAPIAKVS